MGVEAFAVERHVRGELSEYPGLLEQQGTDGFRVAAYRHTADLVESMVVTPEKLAKMGLSAEVAKSVPTGWWIGMRVNDDKQWAQVLSGERAGFSIHGKGSRVSKTLVDS